MSAKSVAVRYTIPTTRTPLCKSVKSLDVAAQNKDFILLQSGVLIVGIVYLAATLIADLLYSLLNPRIRFGSAE